MDTALPQKFPFILDRNLAKANCTGNQVCTSCDTVVLEKRYLGAQWSSTHVAPTEIKSRGDYTAFIRTNISRFPERNPDFQNEIQISRTNISDEHFQT